MDDALDAMVPEMIGGRVLEGGKDEYDRKSERLLEHH